MASLAFSKNLFFSKIHRPRAAMVWVQAHPKDLPVSAEELALFIRLWVLQETDKAELLSFGLAKLFSSTVNCEQATSLPLYGRNFNHQIFWLIHLEPTGKNSYSTKSSCAQLRTK
jgi:hypothetical protein